MRARIVWPKSHCCLIDELIFIQQILLIGYCREFGHLEKAVDVWGRVLISFIFSMSHSSFRLSSWGRGQSRSRQTSMEVLVVTKVKSSDGINRGCRGHRCLFCTLQPALYISASNIGFTKYRIPHSCLTYTSMLSKLCFCLSYYYIYFFLF